MSNVVGVEDSKSSTPLVALNDDISFFDLLIAVLWHSGLLDTFAAMGACKCLCYLRCDRETCLQDTLILFDHVQAFINAFALEGHTVQPQDAKVFSSECGGF